MSEPVSFGGPHNGFVHYYEENGICAPSAPTSFSPPSTLSRSCIDTQSQLDAAVQKLIESQAAPASAVHRQDEDCASTVLGGAFNCGLAIGTAIVGTPTVVGSVALAFLAGGVCGHATVSARECLSKE